jgi:hypothetical protein
MGDDKKPPEKFFADELEQSLKDSGRHDAYVAQVGEAHPTLHRNRTLALWVEQHLKWGGGHAKAGQAITYAEALTALEDPRTRAAVKTLAYADLYSADNSSMIKLFKRDMPSGGHE